MFNRKMYKEIAKKQLSGRLGTPILATLISSAIIWILEIPSTTVAIGSVFDLMNTLYYMDLTPPAFYYKASNISWLFTGIEIAIGGILSMAATNLYIIMSHTTEKQSLDSYFKGFSMWLNGFLGTLWQILWVCLWSLLFVIPGIIKAISYSQMFFILAENPDIGVCNAMNISKRLTKGFKGDLFVMYLSFIGWAILGSLTFGILNILWVHPYMNMSMVNAYHAMKEYKIKAGDFTPEDF